MKLPGKEMSLLRSLSRQEARKLGCGAIVAGCLLPTVFFFAVLDAVLGPADNYKLKLTVGPDNFKAMIESARILQQSPRVSAEPKVEKLHACDFSHRKWDVCYVEGDVRIDKNSSTIFFFNPRFEIPANGFWKIRPYVRKTDLRAMSGVTELKVNPLVDSQELPACSVIHTAPGLVFSTGGYNGNLFHDFADVIVPLFLNSHHHKGEVQFINTNGHSWWRNKFGKILKKLSHYDVIDYDNDDRVHCFTKLRVGLTVHREFSIDPAINSFNGYTSMQEFRKLLMDSFQLKKATVLQETKRPRLLILSRNQTRRIINLSQIAELAIGLGFDVTVADDLKTRSLAKFSEVVNSCDVMMGVHGAGLTNMAFLPDGAVVIQIVPFGGLDWISRIFFADPAMDMKFNYIEYKINVEESTLLEHFTVDDPIIKDPLSIHKQGWSMVEEIYMKQDVRVDLRRFKDVLENAYDTLLQSRILRVTA